jgi:hypothetical protein
MMSDFDVAAFVRHGRAQQGLEERVTDRCALDAIAGLLATATRDNGSPRQGAVAQNITSSFTTAIRTTPPARGGHA